MQFLRTFGLISIILFPAGVAATTHTFTGLTPRELDLSQNYRNPFNLMR